MSVNRTRRRRALLLGVPVLVVSAGLGVASGVGSPAAASTEQASPCLPYQLPGMSGDGHGEVMTMNDAGVYVGRVREAPGVGHAAWWTHTGSDLGTGWALHVPNIPATNAEFLDVNAGGVMSGVSNDSGHGFVYNSNSGEFTWLPDFASGYVSWTRRINASGVVTGSAVDESGTSYAAIWRPPYSKAERVHAPGENQNMTLADGTQTKAGSETDGINDDGTVVGYTYLGGPVHDVAQFATQKQWRNGYAPLLQAFTRSAQGGVTRLPAGYDQAYGFAINNAGLVVGASLRDPNAGFLPTYWRDGVEHDMGAPAEAVAGRANAVSSGGWVAGGITLPDTVRSFVWTGAGTLQLNEPLPGYDGSFSHGVNDVLHQVGGNSTGSDGAPVPTVWQCPTDFTTG
jgi:hypothetical protein